MDDEQQQRQRNLAERIAQVVDPSSLQAIAAAAVEQPLGPTRRHRATRGLRCSLARWSHVALVNCQGRLLFACVSQIAFLLALGIVRAIGNQRRLLPLTLVVVVALLVLDVYCLRGVLVPAYR